ncbi:MAG: DUF1820 family protein [Candidatus Dasytiphilus stammeri]
MTSEQVVYRIQFMNNSKNYQLYVRELANSSLFGFIEIGNFVFTTPSSVLVDPGAEKIKSEFTNVTRSYIPVQAIIRIDMVTEKSSKRIPHRGDNVTILPFLPIKK